MMANCDLGQFLPHVSVIMPAYNAERFIEEAIRSVMTQTYTNWELFVIDDCSKDSTCAIVEKLAAEDQRITLIRNEVNQGVAKTRNAGFDLCKGGYVALIDSDDVWHMDKLEKQLARLHQTNADFSYCSYAIVDDSGNKVKNDYIVPKCVTFEDLLGENVIGCSTVMISSDIVRKYHFNTQFYHEDYVLWLTLLQEGYTAVGCDEVLVDWRYIVNSRSFDKRSSANHRWRIYREYLKLPWLKSIRAFNAYAWAGLRKYFG